MTNERTTKLRRTTWTFGILSVLCFLGTPIYLAIELLESDLIKGNGNNFFSFLTPDTQAFVITILIVAGLCLFLFVLLKEKIRNTMYMLSIVLGAMLYNAYGVAIVVGIWALDDWIIHPLWKSYKNKLTINKELDIRGVTNE